MLSMLIAYNAAGDVLATLDALVVHDDVGEALGLVDFEAAEAAGPLRLRPDGSGGVWNVAGAAGSGTWPEFLGLRAHEFRVELDGLRVAALIHVGRGPTLAGPAVAGSGHRRERAAIEAAIAERIAAANGEPADIRDIVGGPDRPLILDDEGRTAPRVPARRPNLPLIGLDIRTPPTRPGGR